MDTASVQALLWFGLLINARVIALFTCLRHSTQQVLRHRTRHTAREVLVRTHEKYCTLHLLVLCAGATSIHSLIFHQRKIKFIIDQIYPIDRYLTSILIACLTKEGRCYNSHQTQTLPNKTWRLVVINWIFMSTRPSSTFITHLNPHRRLLLAT